MATISENSDAQNRETLISQLKKLTPSDFASRNLLDRVPWLFTDRRQYIDWKAALAAELEIDPYMLIVVGSACLGFSLSPNKHFAPFGPSSDIDVAAVSQRYFDEAWRWLRSLRAVDLLERDPLERDMLGWHRKNLIFDGAIATERLLPKLPFGSKWASALGRAGGREPTDGRVIKVRLYRDFESLRVYHEANIRNLKVSLSANEEDSRQTPLGNLDSGDPTSSKIAEVDT
jgi:hypothetical protein